MSIEVTGFHHVSLLVRDLSRAAAFYEDVLGLKPKSRPSDKVRWFEVGTNQELHLIESSLVPDRHEGHPAMEVSDIQAAVVACASAGATIQQDVFIRPHDESYSAFVRDPDGNLLEFTQHKR